MTKNETIIEWHVPYTERELKQISSNCFREGLRLLIIIVVLAAITLPIMHRVFSVANGHPPYVAPLLLPYGVAVFLSVAQMIMAIRTRSGKQKLSRNYCISERGFNLQRQGGFLWKNAICYEVHTHEDDSSPSICVYHNSGLITRAKLPFEPERSSVLKSLEKLIHHRNSTHQIVIRMEREEIAVWKRWIFVVLGCIAGTVVGLKAGELKETLSGMNLIEFKIFLIMFLLPSAPLILLTVALFPWTSRPQRFTTIGWLFMSAVMAIGAFGIAFITTEIESALDEAMNQTPITQSIEFRERSP